MYSDTVKKKGRFLRWLILPVLAALIAVLVFGASGRDISEEGAAAIEAAVRRSALQCYAVEGVYPPDLQYLMENYGLQVNERDYYIKYETIASNVPPTIRVVSKR